MSTTKMHREYLKDAKAEVRPMIELIGQFLARCRKEETQYLFDDAGNLRSQELLNDTIEHERLDAEMYETISRMLLGRLTTRRGMVA